MSYRHNNALGLHIPSSGPDLGDFVHDYPGGPLSGEPPLSPTTVNSLSEHPRLTRQNAIDFMALARRRLHDRPRVFNEFLLSMGEWQRQVIDRPELIGRVRTLFDGYIDLVQGFRAFVPPLYLEDYDNWTFGRHIPPRD